MAGHADGAVRMGLQVVMVVDAAEQQGEQNQNSKAERDESSLDVLAKSLKYLVAGGLFHG